MHAISDNKPACVTTAEPQHNSRNEASTWPYAALPSISLRTRLSFRGAAARRLREHRGGLHREGPVSRLAGTTAAPTVILHSCS